MYAALNAARRRVYRKARSALAACLLKCRVESFRPSSTNGSCCQRRCQDDAMGMMVGGFFAAAAAAASSRSQIDVKPRTQHVKYFISTLIHISSLSLLSGSLYVHGDDGSSFYRGKSPRPPRALLNPLTSLMKKHFYADAVKKLPAETRKYYECPPSPSLCRRYNSIMATPNGVCEISRDENLLLKRFAVERGD
jgi:hypothetical protein